LLVDIFKKPEILDKEKFKEVTLGNYKDYSFTKDAYLVPLGHNEIQIAMKSLIVVFIKENNGEITPVAVLGSDESKNLLVTDGVWKEGMYIPAALRCYPFGLGMNEKGDKFITIDSESDLLTSNSKRLFNENAEETEQGVFTFNFIREVYSNIEKSKTFSKQLEQFGLLKQVSLEIAKDENKYKIDNGIYIVDETSLNKLESRKIKKLATQGILPFIYSHLFSLSNRY